MTKLNKIVCHWTAGSYNPCLTDTEHYHYLVTGAGDVVAGKHKPEDNEDCTDGNYAAHTGGGNTGAIGIAMCGMAGYSSSKGISSTKYPLNKVQCERFFKLIAGLAQKYGITIDKEHVMTHYEFGKAHPKTTSYGKIDITILPDYTVSSTSCGDFIRQKAKWYYINF